VVAVRDGSFDTGEGAFAWVIEGETTRVRVVGRNRVPGGIWEQSS